LTRLPSPAETFVMPMLLPLIALAEAATAPLTLQQRFEAATVAASTGKCAEAITQFTALEATAAGRTPAVRGAILARKSACLLSTGQRADAASAAREAVALLKPGEDQMQAYLTIGRISFGRHDYQAAAASFRQSRDAATGVDQFEPLLWLARATLYDSSNEAQTAADAAVAMIKGQTATDKFNRGIADTLRGRAALNHGDLAGGYAILKAANRAQGGLTTGKVTMSEVVTRSDLAIAALLNHDDDAAREALAYTGAGRFEKSPFATATTMDPPACGGEGDLKPEDFAIVEFAIKDDGSVVGSTPIYVSNGGPAAAAAYAEAVDGWTWQGGALAAIPAFFRAVTRVEVRCSNTSEQPRLAQPLIIRAQDWLDKTSPWHPAGANEVSRVAAAREVLASTAQGTARIGPLLALADSELLERGERIAMLDNAIILSREAKAPPAVLAYLDLSRAQIPSGDGWRDWRSGLTARIQTLAANPVYMADPEIAATLYLAEAQSRRVTDIGQVPALQAVADDQRLPAESPLKQAALLRLSSVSAATGQVDQARDFYRRTGLDAQQCALIDMQPAMTKSGASSSDFPMEAQRWGFEGWVKTEFDIAANGRTADQRVVIAYPPLVFRNAGLGIIRDSRWEPRFRPDGGKACSAKQQSIHFRIAH
jgi:hypothetical protein